MTSFELITDQDLSAFAATRESEHGSQPESQQEESPFSARSARSQRSGDFAVLPAQVGTDPGYAIAYALLRLTEGQTAAAPRARPAWVQPDGTRGRGPGRHDRDDRA
jgi:hypothetical protein